MTVIFSGGCITINQTVAPSSPVVSLVYEADLSQKPPSETNAQVMAAVQSTIERRVNGLGVIGPKIEVQDDNRILVQVPSTTDINQLTSLIGQVALLEFKEEQLDASGNVVEYSSGNPVWIPAMATGSDGTQEELTGKYLLPNSYVDTNSLGQPEIEIAFDSEGAKLMGEITTVLYNNGVNSRPMGIFLDSQFVSAPTVDAVITNKCVINGITLFFARDMVNDLNSGSLDVPITLISSTTN